MIFLYVLIAACSAEYLHLAARNHSKPYMNKSKKDWLILYTNNAPGQLEKEFLNASKAEGTSKLTYSLFNCTKYWDVCEQFRIKEFPYIHYVSRGMVKEYNWDLSMNDFIEFGQKLSMSEIQKVSTVDDFEKFKKYQSAFMLWTLPEFTSETKNLSYYFDAIAKEMQHTKIYFGKCHKEEVAKYAKVDWTQLPSIKKHGSDDAYDFNLTKYNQASLRDFIESHKFGILFNMTRGIEKELSSSVLEGKIFVLAVLDFNNQTEFCRYADHMKSLALRLKKSKDWRYQFALLDSPKFPDIAEKFKAKVHPQLVLIDYRRVDDNSYYFGNFDVENESQLYKLLNDTWDLAIPPNYTIPFDERDYYDEITIGGYLLILLVLLIGPLFIYRIHNTKEKKD